RVHDPVPRRRALGAAGRPLGAGGAVGVLSGGRDMSGEHASSEIAVRVRRLEERLIGAGLTDDAQLDGIIGQILSGSPANGARVVARAWVDPAFHGRLVVDANSALGELGLSMSTGPQTQRLTVAVNTPTTHNVLV